MIIDKKTKVVCTIGPATESVEQLTKLVKAGMNVMRLNFSHGDFAEHGNRVKNLREVIAKTGANVAILQDLSGPKIRLGAFSTERVNLVAGNFITITTEDIVGDENRVSINYKTFPEEMKVGNFVLVDDGKKKFEVVSIKGKEVKCKIIVGGDTKGKRGVNLPGANLKISALTDKDKVDFKFGVDQKVDYVALSFVRRPEDVIELREMMKKAKHEGKIIAKIETPEAVDNIDEILPLVDGLMVARGDLAIEIPAEKVPMVQKMLIAKCNELGKPVITATQMLESMIKTPVPTRAEVSDVANAILDGTDAVMLSEETTLGSYPVEAVEVMARVAKEIESHGAHRVYCEASEEITDAVTAAVVETAETLAATLIVAVTASGHTARMIARHKPTQMVLALTPNQKTFNQLALSFGCAPVLVEKTTNTDDLIKMVKGYVLKSKLAKKGDRVVISTGMPFGKEGTTNTMFVETI